MVEIWTPTNDLVAVAYLPRVIELDASHISTELPTDQTSWADSGFITVNTAGGTPHPDLPQRAPVLTLDFWAVKGKWNLAAKLAESVVDAFEGRMDNATFDVKTNYSRARVLDGRVLTEPRKVRNDPSLFARLTLDLLLHWTKEPVE